MSKKWLLTAVLLLVLLLSLAISFGYWRPTKAAASGRQLWLLGQLRSFTRPSQKATAVKPWMNALGRVIPRSFSEGGLLRRVSPFACGEAPEGATPVKAWGSTFVECNPEKPKDILSA